MLLYFLPVGEHTLLPDLLGGSFSVPRSVYDPEDPASAEPPIAQVPLLSEIRQSISYYERLSTRGGCAAHLVDRLRHVDQLHNEGRLVVVDLTDEELMLAARLASRDHVKVHGPASPLGAGEAACVAIAHSRDWVIATDDNDALKALRGLSPGTDPRYERIRKLLVRAATSGLIARQRANDIHAEMVSLGFWDSGHPFDA